MAYYDRIARKWHEVTGRNGGAFKRFVLNDHLLDAIGAVAGRAILELGAGNGYFMPLLLRRFSGQAPARIVLADESTALLDIARRHFQVPDAEYVRLDVRSEFPFEDKSFDLILATMLFNELSAGGARRALAECHRVLSGAGRLILTMTHPDFVQSLSSRGLLRPAGKGMQTMPSTDGLRLPVVERSRAKYEALLRRSGFASESTDVFPSAKVMSAKPGLRKAGNVPLALVFTCELNGEDPLVM